MINSPRTELAAWLSALVDRFRHRRQFGDSLQVKIAQDITRDVAAVETKARDLGHVAEINDLEAATLLRSALADRQITADEIPVLEQALRHVRRSAAADHDITELLA